MQGQEDKKNLMRRNLTFIALESEIPGKIILDKNSFTFIRICPDQV